MLSRQIHIIAYLVISVIGLSGCTTNPATGQRQFDGLMSRESEAAIGAQEHAKIVKQYGGVYKDQQLQAYVNEIGQKVARNTERPEVTYKFTLLDSPIVNAFALPGGYVYVTRGLMAVANDEAELASVIGHEIAHVTARHQAARYSQGLLTTLGATVIGAAVGDANVTRALSLGNNLYMSSYSRDQESQADTLGIRYLSRAGYDTFAMGDFLQAMGRFDQMQDRLKGEKGNNFSYFSSHPQTGDRVALAAQEAGRYPKGQAGRNPERYLNMIAGMTFGDSADQGFVRGTSFYHPAMGFTFTAPAGYKLVNQPEQVAAAGPDGTVMVLDMAGNPQRLDPLNYMITTWMKGERMNSPEAVTINGLRAATDSFPGTLNGRPVEVRLVAIEWSPNEIFRFQIAMPRGVSAGTVEGLKRATYSFRKLSEGERQSVRPQRVQVVTARTGDTVETLAQRMEVTEAKLDQFLALNNLNAGARIESGKPYKIIAN